jgi:site-specific DNA recombinase
MENTNTLQWTSGEVKLSKKAVIYARVSSDLQKKEGTIQSQIEELRKQVFQNGDELVKEYIDEGFSGAMLDRPAMNQLREDMKNESFQLIYFLNTDRIARDVTYQNLILAEILKYKKEIIINGKDYKHNPENKFTLTVLGAVAELERAKIVERTSRGRAMKLRQGKLMSNGNRTYGYDYHKRDIFTNTDAYLTVNEKEAETVRFIFETYTKKKHMGIGAIAMMLEEKGIPTKKGYRLWNESVLKLVLKNEMYIGNKYFHQMKLTRIHGDNTKGDFSVRKKTVKRPREEWIKIQIPPIISKELFEKAQERLKWNKENYRNPKKVQLLSNMTKCGYCGAIGVACRRYFYDKRTTNPHPYHIATYRCKTRYWMYRSHFKQKVTNPCSNKQVATHVLEFHVFRLIEKYLTDPGELSSHMEFFQRRAKTDFEKLEKKLKRIEDEITHQKNIKKIIMNKYIEKDITFDEYTEKNLNSDNKINNLLSEKSEIQEKAPLFHKREVVETAVKRFCENIRYSLPTLKDFDTKRTFLLENISKVVFYPEKLELLGYIKLSDEIKLPFLVEDRMPRNFRITQDGTLASARRITLNRYLELTGGVIPDPKILIPIK